MIVPAVAFVALLGFAVARQGGNLEVGEPVPAFTAELLEGEGSKSLADLRGMPVVVNFWASWCVPCDDEAPLFREAYSRYGKRVYFVGIDIRDAKSEAVQFVRKYDLDYIQLRDEDLSIYDDYGLTGQPETFFIDQDGELVEHVPGPVTADVLYPLLDVLVARDA